jgi:hypothetical protein
MVASLQTGIIRLVCLLLVSLVLLGRKIKFWGREREEGRDYLFSSSESSNMKM